MEAPKILISISKMALKVVSESMMHVDPRMPIIDAKTVVGVEERGMRATIEAGTLPDEAGLASL